MNFQRFGGRTYVLAMGCGVVNTLLVCFKVIPPEVYATIILGTVAAYITKAGVDNRSGVKRPEEATK